MADPWDAVARGAQQVVRGAAERELRRGVSRVVPRALQPLIPGYGGSIRSNLEGAARRQMVRWLIGLGFGAAFAVVIAGVLMSVAAAVVVAVLYG